MDNQFFAEESRTSGETTAVYYENISKDDRAVVFIVHGLAEHAARYTKFARILKANGYGTATLDLPGHGKTAGGLAGRGVWPSDGFNLCIELVKSGIENTIQKYGKPVVLFGHSMGSFITLGFIEKYGDIIDGCILSGTNDAQPGGLIAAGKAVASIQCIMTGADKKSKLLDSMSFGSFNSHFKPNRTSFDWLSRDKGEVDKYIKDQYCGFIATPGLFRSFLNGLGEIYKDKNIMNIPRDLPIHIFAGAHDPVGDFGKGPQRLKKRLKAAGIKRVSCRLYEEARHECLNEINKEKVMENKVVIINDLLWQED